MVDSSGSHIYIKTDSRSRNVYSKTTGSLMGPSVIKPYSVSNQLVTTYRIGDEELGIKTEPPLRPQSISDYYS